MNSPAFVAPTLATSFTGARTSNVTSRRPLRSASRPQRARVVCAAAAAEKGEKKKAPVVFAKDMKGNFVWTMRVAGNDDVSAVAALFGDNYPRSLVESFIQDSASCTICEASVKGTKEGEGYSNRVMGAALVDLETRVKNPEVGFESGFMQTAFVRGTFVDPQLPEPEDVKKKLLLGAMKKLKANNAFQIAVDVASSDKEVIELLKGCSFKAKGTGGSRVEMTCNLIAENPDPEKKMS